MYQIDQKISPQLSIIDESYNVGATASYCLKIQLGYSDCTFAVLDALRNKYIVLQSYTFDKVYNDVALASHFKNLVRSNDMLLADDYKEMQISVVNTKSTLVPTALYNADDIDTYLNFNHDLGADDLIYCDNVKIGDIQNIYAVSNTLQSTIDALLPKAKIIHYSTGLLQNLLLQYKNRIEKRVFVNMQMTHFEIIVTEGRKLHFYNTFKHQTSEDFLYYLLFVCEQLQLSPEKIDLVLLGEVEKNSAIYDMLYKYVRNINFIERNEQYEYSYGFGDVPAHFYCNLLNQSS
jgi:hypothetical protein